MKHRTKPMSRGHLINKINRIIPESRAVPREDFDGAEGGIWLRGSESTHEGERIFNYWAKECAEINHPKLQKILDEANWYAEPYDAGTLMLWSWS